MALQRVTGPLLDVLGCLLDHPDGTYGYRVQRVTGKSSGTVYQLLTRLHGEGWVQREWSRNGVPARLMYQLTDLGSVSARKLLADRGRSIPNQRPGT